jgi:hypothetical protein
MQDDNVSNIVPFRKPIDTPFLCHCEVNGEYTVIPRLFIDGVFSRHMYTNGVVDHG